jgi:hypothetical protein
LSIIIYLDNSTAVCYINKEGGTKSAQLTAIAKLITGFCEQCQLSVQAVHLAGVLNGEADKESRSSSDASDWMLDSQIFASLNEIWPMEVDLFGSFWNAQLPRFVSWRPQPEAMAVNAFSVNWSDFLGYLFPPFSMIPKCLEKIRREESNAVMICPVWPSQPWYPVMLGMVCETPNLLSSATVQQSTGFTAGRAPPIAELRSAPASRMEIIRQGFRERGFSSSLVDLLVAGSRTSTLSTFESEWRNWAAWGLQRGENPLSTSLNYVLEFLAELHASGKSYSTINVHRSMISKTLPLVEGKPIGSHPLIKNILNGCYNLNPPKPKYNSSWDPNVAITFITSLGDNRLLRLTTLSRKTVVLLALASLLRVSELAAINLQSIAFSNNGLNFSLLKPRKAQHSGPLQSFFIPSLKDPGSCPVEAVRLYIDVTAPYRNSSNNTNRFISCIKTPSRCNIKYGERVDTFSPHKRRHRYSNFFRSFYERSSSFKSL